MVKFYKQMILCLCIFSIFDSCVKKTQINQEQKAKNATDTNVSLPKDNYIYATNQANFNLIFCKLDTNNEIISNSCKLTGDSFAQAEGLLVYNKNIYVTNLDNNKIVGCKLSDDGSVVDKSCKILLTEGKSPRGININNNFLYYTNHRGNSIGYCSLDNEGNINESSCKEINKINSPYGIDFLNSNVFISNERDGTVTSCIVNKDGSFSSCNISEKIFSSPRDILMTKNGLYVTNFTDKIISKCNIENNMVKSCIKSRRIFTHPRSLSLINNKLYIGNLGNFTVNICNLDTNTGDLIDSSCKEIKLILGSPRDLEIMRLDKL